MTGIDVNERTSDRGKHLVDLLAEGLGQPQQPTPADDAHDRDLRRIFALGGVSIALLFTAVTTVLIS